ncbi:MAG: ABC transporter permease, partial [Minwuiales bacterium]|nr:ABC transporter permease [Minwuiales bacterium]
PAFSLGAAWAYARREATELRRDPIRQAFALLGPLLLMAVLGYGVSFDVEDIAYAALDRDRTTESRAYLDKFVGSRYFQEEPPIRDYADMDRRLAGGALRVAIEVPPNFGADIKSGRSPEVGIWLDGAMPFQAETSRGYVEGLHRTYLDRLAEAQGTPRPEPPVRLESRYRYNQDFQSVVGMVPGIVMLLLILIPSMMTAVGVVREKEMGSISNLYATPVTGLEFLVGKQLPYVALAMINFISLVLLADFLFGVSVNGSLAALTVGALTYVTAATGIGLLFSTFVGTQIAAIFGTAIVTTVPALQFSGLLGPVSSLTGGAKATSLVFPSGYFQQISLGAFAKELNFADLYQSQLVLAGFAILFLGIAWLLLKTQEE